jgi:hypothetical protein|mmetsp:Transcript_49633/g.130535  ORF Transcript_49633/g.130535 Transcript_49633/m.130535 type:complete len:291 (+) Transcript_49633:26-898(+)
MLAVDGIIAAYLLIHGVIALTVDIQGIIPDVPSVHEYYRQAGLAAVVEQWVAQEGDFLMGERPLWFKAIIAGEVLLQVPLCFALGYGWLKSREWVRTPGLLYSVHVLTTMVPIMVVLCTDPRPTLACTLIYGVWVVLPAVVLLRCFQTSPLFRAPARTLWKIATPADVEAWESSGLLTGSSLDLNDGFMHASDGRMIRKVASMFFRGKKAVLLEIPPAKLPPSTVWLSGADVTDGELVTRVREKADGDYVRALDDGCLHVHLRTPLPMGAVRIIPLEMKGGEHDFPAECH